MYLGLSSRGIGVHYHYGRGHSSRQQAWWGTAAENSHLSYKVGGREGTSLWNLSTCPPRHTSSNKAILSNLPQTISSTGDQVVNIRAYRAILIQSFIGSSMCMWEVGACVVTCACVLVEWIHVWYICKYMETRVDGRGLPWPHSTFFTMAGSLSEPRGTIWLV